MLKRRRLQASIESGDIQIINMHVESDGDQVLDLFKCPVEKVRVLRELMADMRTLRFTSTRTSVAAVATDYLHPLLL